VWLTAQGELLLPLMVVRNLLLTVLVVLACRASLTTC
jgi:hypothetical protein